MRQPHLGSLRDRRVAGRVFLGWTVTAYWDLPVISGGVFGSQSRAILATLLKLGYVKRSTPKYRVQAAWEKARHGQDRLRLRRVYAE